MKNLWLYLALMLAAFAAVRGFAPAENPPAEVPAAAVQEAPSALASRYVILVQDQRGQGVAGVMINFCSDDQGKCTVAFTDAQGEAVFADMPKDTYHASVLRVPEGYTFAQPLEATVAGHERPADGADATFVLHREEGATD